MDVQSNQENLVKTNSRIIFQNDSVLKMQWQQKGKRLINTAWQLHTEHGKEYGTLQWYIDFHLPWYPWEKFGSLFYEGNYGRMMEQGLYNIKKEIEK